MTLRKHRIPTITHTLANKSGSKKTNFHLLDPTQDVSKHIAGFHFNMFYNDLKTPDEKIKHDIVFTITPQEFSSDIIYTSLQVYANFNIKTPDVKYPHYKRYYNSNGLKRAMGNNTDDAFCNECSEYFDEQQALYPEAQMYTTPLRYGNVRLNVVDGVCMILLEDGVPVSVSMCIGNVRMSFEPDFDYYSKNEMIISRNIIESYEFEHYKKEKRDPIKPSLDLIVDAIKNPKIDDPIIDPDVKLDPVDDPINKPKNDVINSMIIGEVDAKEMNNWLESLYEKSEKECVHDIRVVANHYKISLPTYFGSDIHKRQLDYVREHVKKML